MQTNERQVATKKEHHKRCSCRNAYFDLPSLPSLSFFSMMPASSEKVRMKSSAKNGFAKSEKNPAKKSPNDSKNPFSGLPATVFVFKIGLHFAIAFSSSHDYYTTFRCWGQDGFFFVFRTKIALFANKCLFCFYYFILCVKLVWNILWSDLWQKKNTNRKT